MYRLDLTKEELDFLHKVIKDYWNSPSLNEQFKSSPGPSLLTKVQEAENYTHDDLYYELYVKGEHKGG